MNFFENKCNHKFLLLYDGRIFLAIVVMYLYKIVPTPELLKDDFVRRTYLFEQLIAILDNNVMPLKHVLFSDEGTVTLHGHANR